MFKLMGRMQNTVLAVAGIATAGLFGISVTDIKGCAQSSEIHGQELSADMRMKILRKLKIGSTLSNRSLPGDRIDEIINNYAASLARAEREGLGVSNHELALFLHQQFGGKDNYANFRRSMEQSYGLVASELEDYFRDQLLMSKSARLPLLSTYVTTAEVKEEFHRRHDKMVYDRLAIDIDSMKLAAEPTEEELKTFFEENSSSPEYQVPEKVSIAYVMVSPDKVAAPNITEEDLREYYNMNRDDYKSDEEGVEHKPYFDVAEQVRTALDKKLREEAAKRLLNEVDNVILEQEQIQLLSTFEAMKTKDAKFAVAVSGTSELFSQKDYRVETLGYVFNLGSRLFGDNPRNYGGVLEAGEGLYLYHVVDRQAAREMTFEEAKSSLVEALSTKKKREAAEALAATWKQKSEAVEDWSSMELADGMSYRKEESEGLMSAETRKLEDLEIGAIAEPQTLRNEVVVMRLKERVVAETDKLEAEKEEIKQNLERQKGYQLASSLAQ